MEYDFGTLSKLLFITANQIAYPASAPANTSIKKAPSQQSKYSPLDYRNITDNQGWLSFKIDYSKFKPKKYFKDVSEQQLENHLQALQKKQSLLKHFKYHDELDRIDYQANTKAITYQNQFEKLFFTHFIACAILSRIFTVQTYFHQFSTTLWRHTFKQLYFYTLPVPLILNLLFPYSSPVNHEYFRTTPKQIRMYQGIAYDVDAYQYVNDMKYNFKYPERVDFYTTTSNFFDKKYQYQHYDAIKYWKRVYGIVDPQPFWNKDIKNTEKQSV